ncbi:iron-sulfur cluster assembly scaffold protein [bacterium]|nr:iron-sulfur cluster assembly scaffold protein [candidate division CSSED10-310 bacterium]
MNYTEKVLEHFSNPRNVGELPDPDGIGKVGSPACGDVTIVHIKVVGDRIEDIRFKTFGCAAAIASSSMLTEMVKGATLDEALLVDKETIAAALGGLPEHKLHCSVLAADALRAAIDNYRHGSDPQQNPPLPPSD